MQAASGGYSESYEGVRRGIGSVTKVCGEVEGCKDGWEGVGKVRMV